MCWQKNGGAVNPGTQGQSGRPLSGFSITAKDEPTGPDEFYRSGTRDVVSALMNLGYNRNEAGTAVAGALKENREEPQELSALLRLSLKRLQKS